MLFANNANTTLASSLTNVATTMSVTSASAFPSPTGSQYFYCTLADAATQTTIEIVKVTAVSGTTFTITRGQDGTSGTAFASGAVVSLRLVRASLNDFPKLDEANTFTFAPTFNTALAVGSGGTGITSLTSGYVPYGNGTGAFSSSSGLQYNGAGTLGVGGSFTTTVTNGIAINNATAGNYPGIEIQTAGVTRFFINATSGASYITSVGTNPMVFYTNSAEVGRFDSSGNWIVGNGATAITSVGSATGKATFNSGISTTNGTNSTCYTNASGFEGLWFNAGFYRVYNASAVGVYLTSGGTTWVPNISDERLKNKVNDITDGLDAINKLEPLTFYYKNEKQIGTPRYGFFAQNVGTAIPDAMIVSPETDDTLGQIYTYDTSIINVYLVKALQELSNKFDAYVASHP